MSLSLKPKPSRVATEYWHGLTSIENTIKCLTEGKTPIFSSNYSINLLFNSLVLSIKEQMPKFSYKFINSFNKLLNKKADF